MALGTCSGKATRRHPSAHRKGRWEMTFRTRVAPALRPVAVVALVALLAAACATTKKSSGGAASSGGAKTIALLLPETKTTRYEAQDRPKFEAKVKALCSDCKILYQNADQDASKQQN